MRFILIRHAESRHSIEKIIAVRSACPGLTERGFAQANTLAQRLQVTGELDGATHLLCSPALCARQTAEAIDHITESPAESRGWIVWDQYRTDLGHPARSWFSLAEITDLVQRITYRQEGTPVTFTRYAWTTHGSIYGPAAGQKHLTVKTPIKNFYVAGSGTMGSGIESVVIAGIHAANEI